MIETVSLPGHPARVFTFLLAGLFLTGTASMAQEAGDGLEDHVTARPIHRAVRATGEIAVDGVLDEAAWSAAPIIDRFVQVDPEEGQPASERTEARILYDDEALYIGVRLHDRQPVQSRLGRRDMALLDSDWLGVVIDSYHDHRTGFTFDVNPAGVQRDAVKSVNAEGRESDDNSWDAVWDVATTVDEGGWTAEYRIPFSQIRFSQEREQTWGILLERMIGRRAEYSTTTYVPKIERGGIPSFGHLLGVSDIEQGNRLELLPYVVARNERIDPGVNPFREDSESFGSAGLDLRWRATSTLTLNATLNPDFGQVEVDPAVVNLGVYETFFEEKRPFFVEGSEIFDFGRNTSGGQMFYSRRVGRAPQLAPPGPADAPEGTTILGAGKFTGKTSNGWSLGLIEAVTQEEKARFMDPATGAEQDFTVEPMANYLVARGRRDLRQGLSALGFMLTAVNRRLSSPASEAWLRSGAYSGGLDFRHEFGDRAWLFQGSAAWSHIRGSPEALVRVQTAGNHFFQRPDASHLDVETDVTSMTGHSVGLSLTRQAGEHWRGEVAVAETSPGYEVNDLGFQIRTDRRDLQANLSWVQTRPGAFFRNYSIALDNRLEHNFDWERIQAVTALGFSFRTLDFWNVEVGVSRSHRAQDDRSTRGGPLMERPATTGTTLHLGTDSRRALAFGLLFNGTRDAYDGWSAGGGLRISFRSDRWNVTTGPAVFRGLTQAQYVATIPNEANASTYGADYIFAPLERTEVSFTTRLNVTFTPRLSLETYVQPYIASGDYKAPAQLVQPGSYDFAPRLDLVESGAFDPDFNLRSLRGNAVLRWEWRPGSTLYLAWQQVRTDYASGVGDFEFGRDRRALFDAPPDNIFLIKVNYWLTP
ncbi:MAG: carbohydrate binding family 9 domain-containing protein [Gemmatimonadales bacterium]|nr:MAG: carbohydrate binding family 9 domain-containing protein [Gemmatimonadales bacterium]